MGLKQIGYHIEKLLSIQIGLEEGHVTVMVDQIPVNVRVMDCKIAVPQSYETDNGTFVKDFPLLGAVGADQLEDYFVDLEQSLLRSVLVSNFLVQRDLLGE